MDGFRFDLATILGASWMASTNAYRIGAYNEELRGKDAA